MCLFQGFQCAWELKSQNPGFSAALIHIHTHIHTHTPTHTYTHIHTHPHTHTRHFENAKDILKSTSCPNTVDYSALGLDNCLLDISEED